MNIHLKSRLKLFGRAALDLFYPRDCVGSGITLTPKSAYRYLSDTSVSEIHWSKGPACLTCGYPFSGELIGARICPSCKDLEPIFSSGKTAFMLKGTGKKLIHELKYHKGLHLLPDLIHLVKQVPGYIDYLNGAILVPVPLHRSKLRKRGFNQSYLLATRLASQTQGATVIELLKRVKATKTQTYLDRQERQKNVKNAFALRSKAVINGNLRYIIIDDVFTTGATLNACAAVLKKNGANNINILTLGHG